MSQKVACLGGSEEGTLNKHEHEGNFWGNGNALHLALGSGDSVYQFSSAQSLTLCLHSSNKPHQTNTSDRYVLSYFN